MQSDLVQVPFKLYLHGCQRMIPGLLSPLILHFSTHFDLVTLMARKVWRHSGSVFVVHDRYTHAGN